MKLEDSGKQTNTIITLKLNWKKNCVYGVDQRAVREPLGKDLRTNGFDNTIHRSFLPVRHHNS
jgi:hypothetical protein